MSGRKVATHVQQAIDRGRHGGATALPSTASGKSIGPSGQRLAPHVQTAIVQGQGGSQAQPALRGPGGFVQAMLGSKKQQKLTGGFISASQERAQKVDYYLMLLKNDLSEENYRVLNSAPGTYEIQDAYGHQVCEMILENGWLTWVETASFYRRRGWATKLACWVIRNVREFLASQASQQMHQQYDKDDTRYLTTDGAAFINGLIRKGVFNPANLRDPFL